MKLYIRFFFYAEILLIQLSNLMIALYQRKCNIMASRNCKIQNFPGASLWTPLGVGVGEGIGPQTTAVNHAQRLRTRTSGVFKQLYSALALLTPPPKILSQLLCNVL